MLSCVSWGAGYDVDRLIHEKPSICIPGKHFERSFNAQQMQRNQLAYWMSIYELRPRKLKRLVQMAMDEIDRERLHLFSKKLRSTMEISAV